MKKYLTILLVLILLAGVGGAGGFLYYKNGLKAVGSKEETVQVSVNSGETFYEFISDLKDKGLISNELVCKLFLKMNSQYNLQVNNYNLNKGMTFEEILKVVSSGDTDYLLNYQMTVPEGVSIPEVASIVAKYTNSSTSEVLDLWSDWSYLNDLIDEYWFLSDDILQDGIINPLEGYLFPETYTFNGQAPTIDRVTHAMLDMTEETLSGLKTSIQRLGFSVHEFLSFASVVERESLFDSDRPMIAGVFMNRLDEGWNLQSDITVLYALNRTGIDVSYEDLKVDSPYNTYLNPGLPIGPISNVSKVTMESCAKYDRHDYFFFYACPDGTVLYARDIDEHNANVEANPWD